MGLTEIETVHAASRATDLPHPYLHTIFEVSDKYLRRVFNERLLKRI